MPQIIDNAGLLRGGSPLSFIPALTTGASKRMKTHRFSYFSGFAAREHVREANPVIHETVANSHFFDTMRHALTHALIRWFYLCSFIHSSIMGMDMLK